MGTMLGTIDSTGLRTLMTRIGHRHNTSVFLIMFLNMFPKTTIGNNIRNNLPTSISMHTSLIWALYPT